MNLLCATAIGCISAIVTQPIWLAKTRMQLQDTTKIKYRSMSHCLFMVAQEEGLRSLFRGLVPSLLLTSNNALHFMAYEEIKSLLLKHSRKEHLSPEKTLLAATAAKIFAISLTYPYQVIRTRLQLQQAIFTPGHEPEAMLHRIRSAGLFRTERVDLAHVQEALTEKRRPIGKHVSPYTRGAHPATVKRAPPPFYKGVADAWYTIFKYEGARGLYRGLGPNLLRVLPSTGITFVVYEAVARRLGART